MRITVWKERWWTLEEETYLLTGLLLKDFFGKLFATQILLKILKGGVDFYNWFVDVNNESGTFSAILKGVGISATQGFKIVGEVLSLAWNQVKALGTVVQGIFTLNPSKIKEGFTTGFKNIANTLNNLKDQAIKDANDISSSLCFSKLTCLFNSSFL